MNRRTFVASMSSAVAAHATSASSRVRVPCVGVRGRGKDHIVGYSKLKGVEIAALCDIDESVLGARTKDIGAAGGRSPKGYTEFRRLLEDPDIDAVSIATS